MMIKVTAYSAHRPMGDLSRVHELSSGFRKVVNQQMIWNDPSLHVSHYEPRFSKVYTMAYGLEVAEICRMAGLDVKVQ